VTLKKNLKLLLVASEMTPYAKTGGLADVVGSLPKALSNLGNIDVCAVIPKYKMVSDAKYDLKERPGTIRFGMGGKTHEIKLKYAEFDEGWKAYFIDNDDYFGRDNLYGYHDEAQRFAFFSRAVLEMAKALDFKPDVIHCND